MPEYRAAIIRVHLQYIGRTRVRVGADPIRGRLDLVRLAPCARQTVLERTEQY